MNLDDAFEVLAGTPLSINDCLKLLDLIKSNLEYGREETYFSLVEDMNVGEDD